MSRYFQRRIVVFLVLCFVFLGSTTTFAHRVSVFAWVEQQSVLLEAYYSRGQAVRHGQLVFADAQTQQELAKAVTDETGHFRYVPEAAFLATGHDLLIVLNAGEGHQAQCVLDAVDLASLTLATTTDSAAKGTVQTSAKRASTQSPTQDVAPTQPATQTSITLTPAELEAIVAKAVSTQIVPLQRELHALRQAQEEPGLRDILGGIGWILGLLGVAVWLRYRPR